MKKLGAWLKTVCWKSENCKKRNRQQMCHVIVSTTQPGGNDRHSLTLLRLNLLNVIKKLQLTTRNVSRLLLMKTKRSNVSCHSSITFNSLSQSPPLTYSLRASATYTDRLFKIANDLPIFASYYALLCICYCFSHLIGLLSVT